MEERTEKRVTRATMGAAVALAVAASICCVGRGSLRTGFCLLNFQR